MPSHTHMTTCPTIVKTKILSPSAHPLLPSRPLLSLPPCVITNIFHALSPKSQKHPSSQCNHAWIQPAFQLATSNTHLYLLYCQAMYNPLLDSQHQLEFLTTDCHINCFTTLLSGLSSLTLVRRAATPFFDAEFTLQRRIPTSQSPPCPVTTTQTFFAENSTISITQVEQLFDVSRLFPSLRTLHLSNFACRENTHLWTPITRAWSHSLQNLSIEDTYAQFDQRCLTYFPIFRNLQRLVISSRAVRSIYPLQYLTSLNELVLHNCTVRDHQVICILADMTHLRALDLTETYVTPNIVNSLPASLVRLTAGGRDAHCDTQDLPAVIPGLPPIDVRQATVVDSYNHNVNHTHWKKIVVIQHKKLPKLKCLEWGEWTAQRQSPASLRLIMPQLEALSLYGPDYDDEICDALFISLHLKSLELYGCNVTDITAHVISQEPFLQFVNITNCERITPRGLVAICAGRAARTETLESIFFSGQVQAPSDALSDLLEDHRDMFSDTDMSSDEES